MSVAGNDWRQPSQSNSATMTRLMWRDIQMIKTLVIAGMAGTLAFNLIGLVFWFAFEGRSEDLLGFCATFLVMIPSFVAFGAPAMLVGTEEESGTLNWVRTLPVSWQQFAKSKLLVAIGGVAIVWTFALIVAGFLSFAGATKAVFEGMRDLPMLAYVGVPCVFASSSLLLLLLGFMMAYFVRSPLLGLLCSGVLFIVCYVGIILAGNGVDYAFPQLSDSQVGAITTAIGALGLAVLWITQRQLARRRLFSPDPEFISKFKSAVSNTDVRPHSSTRLPLGRRPSQIASLLWQQARQMGPACGLILVSALLFSVPFVSFSEPQLNRSGFSFIGVFARLAPMLSMLACCWLGVLAFYGDNVHRRCGFFADRGISPSRIWWTRLILPAVACLTILFVFAFLTWANGSGYYAKIRLPMLVTFAISFAFGQLVSQWMRRPVLAFFAAPAFMPFCATPIMFLLDRFDAHYAILLLLVPGLLFVTWRLTGLWLEDNGGKRYNLRAAAYTAIAVAIPCLYIILTPVALAFAHTLDFAFLAITGIMP